LNDCAAKFTSTTKEYLLAAFASRKSRNMQSFIGKDLHLDFDWYQLLAFESENLQLAQVEWFQDRVGRKNVWREYVTLRLTVQQMASELYAISVSHVMSFVCADWAVPTAGVKAGNGSSPTSPTLQRPTSSFWGAQSC
jgi:hypothetical protein